MITGQLANLVAEHSRVTESAKEQLPAVWAEAAVQLAQLARSLGLDGNRTDDVLQDVYLTAWEKAPPESSREELRRWLFTVTANRCKLEHRRQNRWQQVLSRLGQWRSGCQPTLPETDLVNRTEERELIRLALDRLPASLRSVLVLRYFSGFNSKEIGKILELPDSTVRSHLRTARNELAQALTQAGYTHE